MTTFLDEHWFNAVRAIGSQVDEGEWLHKRIYVSEEEQDLFLNNEIETPQFLQKKTPAVHLKRIILNSFAVRYRRMRKMQWCLICTNTS